MQMNIGGSQEGMDARVGGCFEGLPSAFDVGSATASQGSDYRATNLTGYQLHRVEVAFGGNGESGLDDIDTQAVELARHAQFLAGGHAAPRRLLSVAQCGVEYLYLFCSSHVAPPGVAVCNCNPLRQTKEPSSVVDDGPY